MGTSASSGGLNVTHELHTSSLLARQKTASEEVSTPNAVKKADENAEGKEEKDEKAPPSNAALWQRGLQP